MSSIGSYIRFFLGIGLAIEVVRLWFTGGTSTIAISLAILYFIFTASHFAFKR